jgi:shikimate dehydrogenase
MPKCQLLLYSLILIGGYRAALSYIRDIYLKLAGMNPSSAQQLFGLLGKKLGHSFSKGYFSQKFQAEKLSNCAYQNFEIPTIDAFLKIWNDQPNLRGMNVTIPYKESVIPFLDRLDPIAKRIGAVNTIVKSGAQLLGFNTDVIGFHASLKNMIRGHKIDGALVLGSGGASKAVYFTLECMNIPHFVVSRTPDSNQLSYDQLDAKRLTSFPLIINTTPLGTYPKTEECPDIPYAHLTSNNYLYDLIYNPEKSLFLLRGEDYGCIVKNGAEMLVLQAEASWKIWKQYYSISHDRL